MKVLLVDDSKAMRTIVKTSFRRANLDGVSFVEAENGREGLRVLNDERPDLVLSDWNMPEMTGIEFLRAARGQGNDVPFGFVTSERAEESERQATEAGAAFLLCKPFTPPQLKSALEAVAPAFA